MKIENVIVFILKGNDGRQSYHILYLFKGNVFSMKYH
jgi:hypothetical protein